MLRLLLFVLAIGSFITIAVSTTAQPTKELNDTTAKFIVATDAKNPWTSLSPNVAADQFQFAIVSDRTGGHRKGVFSKAVHQVNLLQPAFVMSVGDLIEGARQEEMNRTQWDEFDKYAKQFAMPFFYCVGNHDGDNKAKADVWKERLGKAYYHFLYQNCLFLIVNSNDLAVNTPPAGGGARGPRTGFGKEQLQYIEKTLKDNDKVRWTFVFMHHPVWAARNLTDNGWLEFEKMFGTRQYTMFCGHEHIFRKFLRNERSYYQLATTGGVSSMRGIEYGEFDQIAWVTMKKDAPVIAQVALEGILKDDLSKIIPSDEGGSPPRTIEGLNEVLGTVTMSGKSISNLVVSFVPLGEQIREGTPEYSLPGGSGIVQSDGSYKVFQHSGPTGLAAGRYAVTFASTTSFIIDGTKKNENLVPEKYRSATTTPYQIEVKKDVRNRFDFKLENN